MSKVENLHCHTTNSDGELTVPEVMKYCEQYGISAVAFTDHDSLLRPEDIEFLSAYKGPVRWVSGIEITVGLVPDLEKPKVPSLHMVGLFVDPTNKNLKEFCNRAKCARDERMKQIVKNLKTIDIHITEEECIEESGGESVGRPDIVKAIYKHPENIEIIESLYKEVLRSSDPKAIEIGRTVNLRGDKQIPYLVFLSSDSWIPNIYVDHLFKPTWDECVKLIRDAGGLSFQAHYYCYKNHLPVEFLRKAIIEDRLDGLETVYEMSAYDNWNSDFAIEVEATRNELLKIVDETGCLVAGGGDTHKLHGLQEFGEKPKFAERTIGMLDNIVKQSDKKLKWYKK